MTCWGEIRCLGEINVESVLLHKANLYQKEVYTFLSSWPGFIIHPDLRFPFGFALEFKEQIKCELILNCCCNNKTTWQVKTLGLTGLKAIQHKSNDKRQKKQ